jgi:hypothetical protein
MMVNATHAKQAEEVREISAITYGFMASKALFAAVEFDLFTRIARGADLLPALVQATGIAENRLVTLLTALKSLGLITESPTRQQRHGILLREHREISGTTLSSSTAPSATRVSDISARHL